MSATEVATERSEFVDFWNEILVPKFVRYKHILVVGLSHHSEKIFPTLKVRPGDRAVDVGCGFGDTAIQLAQRIGPTGSVLGIDCCEAFLDFGRKDAQIRGVRNIEFVEADVQLYPFAHDYDFCFSRFGTQFFENPVAGLRNMRASLKPGGVMTMIVWRTIGDNPWFGLPKQVVLDYLPPPGDDARSCGPGPFSMADQPMVTKQLQIAGYSAIDFVRVDAPIMAGGPPGQAGDAPIPRGAPGAVWRARGERGAQQHEQIVAAMKKALAPYATPNGIVMDSSSWKITARNPN